MPNFQARIASEFDDPYSAERFINVVIQAIQKTKWEISDLPQGKIHVGVFRIGDQDKSNKDKPKILVPFNSIFPKK